KTAYGEYNEVVKKYDTRAKTDNEGYYRALLAGCGLLLDPRTQGQTGKQVDAKGMADLAETCEQVVADVDSHGYNFSAEVRAAAYGVCGLAYAAQAAEAADGADDL